MSKFKFGDRVKALKGRDKGREGVVVFYDSSDETYQLRFGFDINVEILKSAWIKESDLELLPKTRLEKMADMVLNGAEYETNYGDIVRFINYEEEEPYFECVSESYKGYEKLCGFNSDEYFSRLKRIENPTKKPLKDYDILDVEITAEQAEKIKEIISGDN